MTEPTVCEDSVSPVTSPAICEIPSTGIVNNEGAAAGNVDSSDAYRTRSINTSGSQIPDVVPSLAAKEMILTRSIINEFRHKEARQKQQHPAQESPNSREVTMDVAERDTCGLPQTYRWITCGPLLGFGGVPPGDLRAIASIPWFTRTTVDDDAEIYFNQLSLYAWDGQFYWGVEAEKFS